MEEPNSLDLSDFTDLRVNILLNYTVITFKVLELSIIYYSLPLFPEGLT